MTSVKYSTKSQRPQALTSLRPPATLGQDFIAGLIVATVLIPQAMAYALLAGLPAQHGLYISILPLIIYGFLGSSRVLAIGPTAVISLMVASGIQQFVPPDSAAYPEMALVLALQVGLILILMGVLRLGFAVNFLSHPVLSGVTSAIALIIAFSQLKHLTGIATGRSEFIHRLLLDTLENRHQFNLTVFLLGVGSLIIMTGYTYPLLKLLRVWQMSPNILFIAGKIGPLLAVILGSGVVALWRLDTSAGVAVVGDVPAGLPPLTWPEMAWDTWRKLWPTALAISLVGYVQSISVAQALASRRREKIHPNRELVALGVANLGAALTGGYPVAGGPARSMVNYKAGATSGLASVISALVVVLTVLFLTPLFYFLPQAVLAATIVVAVVGLVDVSTVRRTWRYNKADALSLLVSFVGVLALGIEEGILIGVITSLVLYIGRTSQPHIAVVGRLGQTEHFRNIQRHPVQTIPGILAIRVDESLYFPNTRYLENAILALVADDVGIKHLVLSCNAVNYIDTSALESLENLHLSLGQIGVQLHLAEIKGPVMDRLLKIGFVDKLGQEHIFLSLHQAMQTLTQTTSTPLNSLPEEGVRPDG